MSAQPSPKILSEFEAKRLVKRVNENMAEARGAFKELHDRQGWLALGYASFSEFVDGEIDLSREMVYRLMWQDEINRELLPIVNTPLPEAQTRILHKIPKEQRPEVIRETIARVGVENLTAKMIRDTAEDLNALPMKWGDRGPDRGANWGRGKLGRIELALKLKAIEPERLGLFLWRCAEELTHTERADILTVCLGVDDPVAERAAVRLRLGL